MAEINLIENIKTRRNKSKSLFYISAHIRFTWLLKKTVKQMR